MARVDLFSFTRSISNESTDHADVKEVTVEIGKETVKPVKEDTDQIIPDAEVDVEKTNVKTSQPGPKDGGGDGTAHTVDAKQASVKMDLADVDENLTRDQNGGHDIDALPGKVNAKDNLSASDIRTSVEEHTDVKEGKDNAEESELKTIETGGAECVPEADAMVMDLDGEELEVVGITDASDKGLSEADAAFAKTKDLETAAASVERYVGLLDRLDREGKTLSPELRQTISWALEDIDAQLFFKERVALESFDPTSKVSLEANDLVATGRQGEYLDGEDASAIKSSVSSKLKKIIEAATRMFWRAVNAVVDLYHNVVGDLPKIREQLDDLKSKVKVLEGGSSFQMNNAHRLMVGDEFVGDSRQAIDRVAKTANELLLVWPNSLGKIVDDWAKGRPGWLNFGGKSDALNFAKTSDALFDLLQRAFRDFDSLSPSDRNKVPSGFLDCTRLQWSGPLPGNRAVYAGVNGNLDIMESSVLSKSIPVSFSAIPGEDTHTGSVTVESLSSGEALTIIRELDKLTRFIEDAKKGMAEIRRIGTEGSGNAFADIIGVGGGNLPKMQAGMMLLGICRATTETQHQFFGYLIAMIKGYMGYIAASIKAEASSGDAIEGELAA